MSPSRLNMTCTLHSIFLVLFFVAPIKLYALSFVNPIAIEDVGSLTKQNMFDDVYSFYFGKN